MIKTLYVYAKMLGIKNLFIAIKVYFFNQEDWDSLEEFLIDDLNDSINY